MKKILASLTVFIFLIFKSALAQPSVNIDSLEAHHPPRSAALRSAVIPGLGQAYNRKYWKIPILYAGAGVLVYFINFNDKEYRRFKRAYRLRLDGDSTTIDEFANTALQPADLQTQKDYWRRNRDLCAIGLAALYILNVIDAYVDAHLFYFKVSDDISLQWSPASYGIANKTFAGVNLQLTF